MVGGNGLYLSKTKGLCAQKIALACSIVISLQFPSWEPTCVASPWLTCHMNKSDGARESCDCSLMMSLCGCIVVLQQLLPVALKFWQEQSQSLLVLPHIPLLCTMVQRLRYMSMDALSHCAVHAIDVWLYKRGWWWIHLSVKRCCGTDSCSSFIQFDILDHSTLFHFVHAQMVTIQILEKG